MSRFLSWFRRHPVATYVGLTFVISWAGAVVVDSLVITAALWAVVVVLAAASRRQASRPSLRPRPV